MYEERKDKFSFKSFFLTLLLVLLFIFLMLWIFPTKWDVNKLQSTYDLERLSVLYDEIFANNVERMKDAAIGYFTNERMPKTVGESKKLTLQQMYDLHLVLKMKDKDGNACDVERSYVEMTKYTEEYQLKVNLSCGDQEDYIIVYLGCYDYCSGGICEKRYETPATQPVVKGEEPTQDNQPAVTPTPNKPTPDEPKQEIPKDDEPTPTPITKKYKYEYKLVVDDCTTCSKWSDWQKEIVESSDTTKVETKTEKELKGYNTVTIQTGTKVETQVKEVKERYISEYITKLVVVDTKQIKTNKTTTKEITEEVQVGTVEKFAYIDSGTRVPKDTETTIYRNAVANTPDSCSYCEDETIYTWEVWNIEPVYDVVTKTVTVPVYKTMKIYEEQEVPVYDYRVVEKKEEVTVPVYKNIEVPEYEEVTYYRYQTCTTKKGYTDIKWSYSKFDKNLISKGYKLTGEIAEV